MSGEVGLGEIKIIRRWQGVETNDVACHPWPLARTSSLGEGLPNTDKAIMDATGG